MSNSVNLKVVSNTNLHSPKKESASASNKVNKDIRDFADVLKEEINHCEKQEINHYELEGNDIIKQFDTLLNDVNKEKKTHSSEDADSKIDEQLAAIHQDVIKIIENLDVDKVTGELTLEQMQELKDKLMALFNGNSELQELGLNLVDTEEITEEIMKDITALLKGLKEEVNSKVSKSLVEQLSSDISKKIIKEINEKLNTTSDLSENKYEFKAILKNLNSDGNTGSNKDTNFMNKDEKVLNNLIKEEDVSDKQINRVMGFMNQLIEAKEATSTESVSNLTVNKLTLSEDIIKAVKFMELNGVKDLTVKVMPRALGEVIISVSMESGIMKAKITAANKETLNLINSNLQDINEKLNSSNIKVRNIDVYQDNTSFHRENFNGNNGQQNQRQGNKRRINSIDDIQADTSQESNLEIDSNVNAFA